MQNDKTRTTGTPLNQLKTTLDPLPRRYQRELENVVAILFEEFERVMARKTSEKTRGGQISNIILFGSFARGTWVDDPDSGYKSDYDLLIIVNNEHLTDFIEYWYDAEDRLLREVLLRRIDRDVHFIVHSISDVNDKLSEGHYFFTDIKTDGIALYERKGARKLAKAKILTPERHAEISRGYFDLWFPKISGALEIVSFCMKQGNRNDAAFLLHQSVERAYNCVLLTFTHYVPPIHDIKRLRSFAETRDPRLIAAWPREPGLLRVSKHRAAFEVLKTAYVDARYSEHFTITDEQLTWLTERAVLLNDLVKAACTDHLAALE
ncbi:HEPN domain-containing protein [Rhodospirillum sp. A1_3_36]|uniref:HEPN domain-containing protein n=1 Tax=Rhodospirillum sp. A1_3_36 TaxID=3391666 RepID=UPI0039A4C8F6